MQRKTESRKNMVIGLLAVAALATSLAAAALIQRPGEESWKPLSQRETRSLEMGLAQMRRMQGRFDWIGSQPLASGALAAAALASAGRPDAAALREEVARWVAGVLDSCPSWGSTECSRAQIPLERLALQYPDALPPELLNRLRTAVSSTVAPPNASQIENPWSFSDTENQRVILMARSLVAQVVAGTPDSPAARGWGAFAEAFLKAHDSDGWYEAESPGYLAISINGLLHLADHAPQATVRDLARRQLDLLFAAWAQNQVGGYPAGPKSRTSGVWALSRRSSPWEAWAWLAAGMGDPQAINFMDRPELAVSRYRIPDGVVGLLAGRRQQPPYEIRARRKIEPAKRRDVNTALYSYATPDYVLGAAQSVEDLALRVSGGQEIAATLFCESPVFAPLYLWSRTREPKGNDAHQPTLDQAVASRNLLAARLETPGAGVGHAFLSSPWSPPEVAGDVVVSRCGDAYVALVTEGGWDVAPAGERFPDYYGQGNRRQKDLAGSWVAVPRRQPANVALQAGRRAEDGDFDAWKKKAMTSARLQVVAGEIQFTAGDGTRLAFLPGRRATLAGKPIEAAAYPHLDAPFLSSPAPGRWSFAFEKSLFRFDPLEGARPDR